MLKTMFKGFAIFGASLLIAVSFLAAIISCGTVILLCALPILVMDGGAPNQFNALLVILSAGGVTAVVFYTITTVLDAGFGRQMRLAKNFLIAIECKGDRGFLWFTVAIEVLMVIGIFSVLTAFHATLNTISLIFCTAPLGTIICWSLMYFLTTTIEHHRKEQAEKLQKSSCSLAT